MFSKRQKKKSVEGRPSLGVNVNMFGRAVADGFGKVTGGIGHVTTKTTNAVGDAVGKTTQAVGGAVVTTTQAMGGAVGKTTQAVGGAVRKTGDAVGKGVGKVASRTTSVVKHTTKVIVSDPLSKVGNNTAMIRRKIFPTRARPEAPRRVSHLHEGAPLNFTEIEFLRRELSKNIFFSELDADRLSQVTDAFDKVGYFRDEKIICEGDPGDFFYVLYQGKIRYEKIEEGIVGTASSDPESTIIEEEEEDDDEDEDATESNMEAEEEGDQNLYQTFTEFTPLCFGELALLSSEPRQVSVYVDSSSCILFRLDAVTFRSVVEQEGRFKSQDEKRLQLLSKIPVLKGLDELSLKRLVSAMDSREYEKGATIFAKGDEINQFFIVLSGEVHATNISVGNAKYEDVILGPGPNCTQRSFGWLAMAEKNQTAVADVTAETKVELLGIQGETFRRVLADHKEIIKRKKLLLQLKSIAVFKDSQLDDEQYAALLDMVKHEAFKYQTVLIKEGKYVEASINFVRNGSVEMESVQDGNKESGPKRIKIEKGGYFGQEWLLADQNKKMIEDQAPMVKSNFTVHVSPGTDLDYLLLEDVRKIMDTSMLGLGKPVPVSGLDETIQISDVERHKMLGEGSFGQVWLASYKPKGDESKQKRQIFALKVQSKHQLIETGQAEGVIAEINIMKCLKSPFVIRLYSTFQDNQRVYMLTSLIQGGELESVMGNARMEDDVARFYAAGILEGLTFMHRRHIIHRDLKPENVLINDKGYPVIIDLGFAKYVPDKTYTFCGTPMYIAPEVVQYKGHNKGADHWSWACMVFEMVTAKYPFYESNMAELELFKKVCRGQFKLYGFMSYDVKLLIINMFIPDPTKRLGARPNGWQDIYKLSFFDGLDFRAYRKEEIEAPWTPSLSNPLDASNFADHTVQSDKMDTNFPDLTDSQQEMFATFGNMTLDS